MTVNKNRLSNVLKLTPDQVKTIQAKHVAKKAAEQEAEKCPPKS